MPDAPSPTRENRLITLFMLVTERDCMFADYAIESYGKIFRSPDYPPEHFILHVYLNCLSPQSKDTYVPRWSSYPYVQLFDNAAKVAGQSLTPGEGIVSPEGVVRKREDRVEDCDELWTSELPTFSTPLVATVDADFEVLHPDFYFYLLDALASDDRHIGASTSYSPTSRAFDTYSKRTLVHHERNHTWFCIYRREAFTQSQVSHFYYEEVDADGETLSYDSAAYFQHDLRTRLGRTFATLPPQFDRSFIHYGAASKNRSITPRNAWLYRRAFLWAHVGVLYGSHAGTLGTALNRVVRRISRRLFQDRLERVAVERSTYVYDDPA